MQLLSLNFLLYTIGGVWRPIEWSSNRVKLLYSVYTFCSIYSLIFLLVTQFLDIIFIVDTIQGYATNFTMFLSVVSVQFKAFTIIIRRDRIINILETLQNKPCKACNQEEIDIQMKFDRLIRSHSISYTLLATVSATGAVAGGLLDALKGTLPYKVWVPYDYSSLLSFWLTSLQETIAVILGTIINIATETSVLGFSLQICAQLEILKHRLQRMVHPAEENPRHFQNKTDRLSEHICHHLSIIRLAEMINETFSEIIFVQFFASILVLCSSLYHLSSHLTIVDVATIIVYAFCMLVQIFVYCWAGNEVILKSTGLSEGVYQMDWTLMSINERRDLLMIMKRSTRPIKLTSSFLVTLSLSSYGNLLKASYSAFNVLQQS